MKKEYQRGEMTIVWEPGKCIHSGICAKGLPAVFKPSEKPWIQADNSETETIKKQIDACPSGALSYYLKNQDSLHSNDQDTFKVQVIPNGPFLVKNTCMITHKDGREELRENQYHFAGAVLHQISHFVMVAIKV